MKRSLLILAALLGLSSTAASQTRPLPQGEIRSNGDITFGNALKLGKREGNKIVITPDTLQILGTGSSGDVSGMSVTPSDGSGGALSQILSSSAIKSRLGLQRTAPALTLPFDSTPRLGRAITFTDGTDAAPLTGTDPSPSIFLSRVDRNTPGDFWQNRLLSTHFKRLEGGDGSVQSVRFRADDYSTVQSSQVVALTGISNTFGPGAGWGLYSEGWAHSTASRVAAAEFDVANNTGVDFGYLDSNPVTTAGHSKGVWIYGLKGPSHATGRHSFAFGVGALLNAEFQVGGFFATGSLLKYGLHFAASPPIGILFSNGASTNGLGTTQGGIGIDFGPNNKGYGTAADQGAIHLRGHRLLAGLKSSEGGSGATYLQFLTAENRWAFYSEGTLVLRIGKGADGLIPGSNIQMTAGAKINLINQTAGTSYSSIENISNYTILRGGAAGTLLRNSADQNVVNVGTAAVSPGGDNTIDLGVAGSGWKSVRSHLFTMPNYASMNFLTDAAAAAGGVPVGGIYHNAGSLRVRIN